MTLTAKNIKKILGFTLIEILIGIVISAIMMGAMFTTYTVVNNSYSQVSDIASISRSGRDVVSMMMRDVRMAGFKYYYGVFEGSEEGIPALDFLEYKTGDTEDTKYQSHAPIIIYKDTLNYKEITGYAGTPKGVTSDQKLSGKDAEDTKSLSLCCDRIHIVYGDFDANTDQAYKKYRISYFALPMQKMSGTIITDRYYAIYRSKESWQQPTADDPGKWISESNDFCPDCYQAELMREYLVDMEFIALDAEIMAGHTIRLSLLSTGEDYLPASTSSIVTIQEGAGSTLQLDTFDPDADDRRYWTPPVCTHDICE